MQVVLEKFHFIWRIARTAAQQAECMKKKDAAIRAWNRRINDEVNKLKPCPFCGAIPAIQKNDFCWQLSAEHEKGCFIRQMNGMNGNGKMSAYSKDVLIETWNRRANDEQ